MNKRHLLLFCAIALSALLIPIAKGYTVITLGATHKGPRWENFEYEHHSNVPRSAVEKRSLEGNSMEGGINPKIVLSTGKPGYFAVAVSTEQQARIVGWSGPLPNPEAATKEAIANCRKRGGVDPRIKVQWADGVSGKKQ
jgi:hypothetical protein